MPNGILFELDGTSVVASSNETILDCALRLGISIQHQCCHPEKELPRPGRCRSCLVEVEGERVLKASCREKPRAGAKVFTASDRLQNCRETLASLSKGGPSRKSIDDSHPALILDRDACIQCGLCVYACRDIQGQDVLGLANRGNHMEVVFDLDTDIKSSDCVACGQCIEVCPTGALRSKAYSKISNEYSIRSTDIICPYCCVGCSIKVEVSDNRIVNASALEGPTNKGRLCVKGRFGLDFVQHPDRLTVPLIRIEGVPKSAEFSDWRTVFRETTWDEALDFAATGLRRLTDKHGPDSIALFGSLKTCNEDGYLLQKLARIAFGTNNVDHPTRLCHASSTAALLESVGMGAPSSQISECSRADVIFLIGANPSTSHPVAGSFIRNAVRSGSKLIIVDPRGQPLDRFASHILRFKAGTDVVLLNALIGIIIEEELIDRSFIDEHVDGFEEIANRCKDFPPTMAADICGVEIDLLRTIAREYATAKAAMTIWGMGMTQHTHGTNNIRSLISLALICGHVGRPGTGLYPIRGHNNAQGAPDSGILPHYLPDYQPVASPEVRKKFEAAWGRSIPEKPGLTMIEVMKAIEDGNIFGLYAQGANPALCMPGLEKVRNALASLEHLVVQDIFITDTAKYADVILPAAALLEKEGTLTNIDRRIQITHAAMSSPGEARPDWWIIQEIANRCGVNWSYSCPEDVFEEMRHLMPSITGISWSRLEREKSIQYPCKDSDHPGTPFLFENGFNTSNRRARLVPASSWKPGSITSPEFPLIMTTGRTLEHLTGTMSTRSTVLNALDPIACIRMNADDMKLLNLNDNDPVLVRSREGSIETLVKADPALAKGLVFAPYCLSALPSNKLTSPAMDPSSRTAEMKFSAISVERSSNPVKFT